MLLEDTAKYILIGECQIVLLSFLLTADSNRREHFTECNVILAVQVMYYGRKYRALKSLKTASYDTYRHHPCVYLTLQEQQLYPCYLQTVQELGPCDASARCAVCSWILQEPTEEPMFTTKVSFADKLCFTRTGIININNEHLWSNKHSYAIGYHSQKRYVSNNM
jgi:hypothetical protein